MANTGKLKKKRFGYSGPAESPLFQAPPFYYRGVEGIIILYETEAEAV
jgi:hypothetical protein